jgi:hypothetical protein
VQEEGATIGRPHVTCRGSGETRPCLYAIGVGPEARLLYHHNDALSSMSFALLMLNMGVIECGFEDDSVVLERRPLLRSDA